MGEDTAAIMLELGALGVLSPAAAAARFVAIALDWHDSTEYWRHIFDNGVRDRMDIAGLPLPGVDTE